MRAARLMAVVALLVPEAVFAQTVTAGAMYERYSFGTPETLDIETLTLFSAPFGAVWQAGRSVAFRLAGAAARGSLIRANGEEGTIAGLTDAELSARVELAGGRAAFTGIVLLPTGSESLTYEEVFVAGAIAADLLPFGIRDWGTGGGAGASLALATPLGSWAAGASVGYVVAREYEPLSEESFEYRPGNQLHVRAALDRVIGRSAKFAVSGDWRRYGEDRGNGNNIFQTGDRFRITGSLNFAVGRGSAVTYAGWLSREEGEYTPPPDIMPSQDLFFAGAGLRSGLAGAVLTPSLDLRVFDSGGADRSGYVLGIGTAVELNLAGSLVVPNARFRFGNVESEGGDDTGLSGFMAGLSIRFGGGRP